MKERTLKLFDNYGKATGYYSIMRCPNTEDESTTVIPENQDADWDIPEDNEPKRIYVDRLDVDYFIKCVESSVDYLLNECSLPADELKKGLETIKSQVYGLRDVFWLFTSDNVLKIAEPVKKALEGLEGDVEA